MSCSEIGVPRARIASENCRPILIVGSSAADGSWGMKARLSRRRARSPCRVGASPSAPRTIVLADMHRAVLDQTAPRQEAAEGQRQRALSGPGLTDDAHVFAVVDHQEQYVVPTKTRAAAAIRCTESSPALSDPTAHTQPNRPTAAAMTPCPGPTTSWAKDRPTPDHVRSHPDAHPNQHRPDRRPPAARHRPPCDRQHQHGRAPSAPA